MNALTRDARARRMRDDDARIEFTLDGRAVAALRDETILEAARRVGVEIPHLCWSPQLDAVGNCHE